MIFIGTSYVFKHTRDIKKYVIYAILTFIASTYFAPENELDKFIAIILFSSIVLVRFFAFKLSRETQKLIRGKDANIQSIIDNLDGIIWSIDTDYKLLAFNNTFQNALLDLKNTKVNTGDSILNEHIISFTGSEFRTYYLSAFQEKKISIEKEFIIQKETKTFLFSFTPIKVEGNTKTIGITVYGRDITLERIRENELIEAKETSESLARIKQDFLANMSNEIRTPLNGIIGFTDLLLDSKKLDQDTLDQLNIIKRSSDILLVLINDILDISKIDAGKIRLEEVNIDEIIKHIIENFKNDIKAKGLKFNYTTENTTNITFICDPVRVSQILLNLISNSIKFTPQNGEINIHISSNKINEFESNLNFEIKDNGIGIEKENLETIFNPFVQSEKDTTRKYGGIGLGLSIVKKLIELMSGSISVSSELGKGSTFVFNLKLKHIRQKNIGLKPTPKKNDNLKDKPNNTYVLVAEDNAINQLLIKKILSQNNLQFDICKNGEEAFQNFKHQKYDVILMDLMMPILDGYQASKKIREFEKENNLILTPIIAVSADVTSSDLEKLNNHGINDYIAKPYINSELLNKITKLTEKKL